MLTNLSIRDVVLVEQLDLAAGAGLCVLTGETGAGKSILLDALGLAIGARADVGLIRAGAKQAVVSAAFDIPAGHPAQALLAEHGLADEDALILRRILGRDGRSRAFVNGQIVSVGVLRSLGGLLVEIQGQFDQTGLLDAKTHRKLLDDYDVADDLRRNVRAAYDSWGQADQAAAAARDAADEARRNEDFLRHAAGELDDLAPVDGEEDDLASTRRVLQLGEQITEAVEAAQADLAGAGGADEQLRRARAHLGRLTEKVAGRLDEAVAALDRAGLETEEALTALARAMADLDVDRGRLETIEDRLFRLRAAARKHGVEPTQLSAVRDEIHRRLALLEDQTAVVQRLNAAAERARERFVQAGRALSAARTAAAQRLDAAVQEELQPLKLGRAGFRTRVEPMEERDWGPYGTDRVLFEVSTNPGTPYGPLQKIASGGELSRFLLAIKVCLAQSGTANTLIFDEVDSGIGGATATAVGERLHRLAQYFQVLVVTHSPQVAAVGNDHLRVEKRTAGGVSVTEVDRLDAGSRREEVARMLAGATITDEARAAADQLIAGNAA